MSTGGEPGHEHPIRTRNDTNYRYFFSDKHHGRGGPEAAQWARDLSEDEEFSIFDQADTLDLLDSVGNLYGVRPNARTPNTAIILGTLDQEIAKFPWTRPGQPWHGFPLAPIRPTHPPHPPYRWVPGDVLKTMQARGLISERQFKRLKKRRHS